MKLNYGELFEPGLLKMLALLSAPIRIIPAAAPSGSGARVDAKPIVDRIREIADIVWQTQTRAEELRSGTSMPFLEKRHLIETGFYV